MLKEVIAKPFQLFPLEFKNLKTWPTDPEPSSVLFGHGPLWSRKYQRTQKMDRLDDRFMYKDQGPPMYRLLGAHYAMYPIPNKTDFHTFAKSYHFQNRGSMRPDAKNEAATFPGGVPPPQTAMFDGLRSAPVKNLSAEKGDMEFKAEDNLLVWDKYRYLPGPPAETQFYRV